MRSWRASQPRGLTEPSGSGSKRFGASGARFFRACAQASSRKNRAANNTATLPKMRTVDSLYISIRRPALLRPMNRNAAQQERARSDFVETRRAEQRCEFSRRQEASQRVWNVSVDARAPVKNQASERALRVKIPEIEQPQRCGIRQKKVQADERAAGLQHTVDFLDSAGKVWKITESVSDENGVKRRGGEGQRGRISADCVWQAGEAQHAVGQIGSHESCARIPY